MPVGSSAPLDQTPLKLLLVGDSGGGKTGALISLLEAGYRVVIMDHDNGVQILQSLAADSKVPGILSNLYWETFTNEYSLHSGKPLFKGSPDASSRALKFLSTGKTADFDLGPVTTWDANTVLVLDSLTFFSTQVLSTVLAAVGRLPPATPQIQDWGAAMGTIEDTLGMLYSASVKCHVIINSHLTMIETEDGTTKVFPNTLGSKLPPKVGRFFNTLLLVKTEGAGAATKRYIYTQPQGSLALKTPAPQRVKPKYELATGLAELFSDLGYVPPNRKAAA